MPAEGTHLFKKLSSIIHFVPGPVLDARVAAANKTEKSVPRGAYVLVRGVGNKLVDD